jgi:hypothetical protein
VKLFVFFTCNTPYAAEAQKTVESFQRFRVPVVKVAYETTKDFMKNCMFRAPRLVELAAQFPKDVIGLLDADVRCAQSPELFKDFAGDMAVHYRAGEAEHRRCWAGCVLFGATPAGRAALQTWAELCKADPYPQANVREQVYLCAAVEKALQQPGFRLLKLPDAYYRPADKIKKDDGTVLVHYECSRFYVKQIGGRLVDHSQTKTKWFEGAGNE